MKCTSATKQKTVLAFIKKICKSNICVLQLYCIFLWIKLFPRLSNTYKMLRINVVFVRK